MLSQWFVTPFPAGTRQSLYSVDWKQLYMQSGRFSKSCFKEHQICTTWAPFVANILGKSDETLCTHKFNSAKSSGSTQDRNSGALFRCFGRKIVKCCSRNDLWHCLQQGQGNLSVLVIGNSFACNQADMVYKAFRRKSSSFHVFCLSGERKRSLVFLSFSPLEYYISKV